MNTTKKPPVWINIPDLIVQVGIVVWFVCNPSDDYLAMIMVVGGSWQLISQLVHWKTGFVFSKDSSRKLHFSLALITLGILTLGIISFCVGVPVLLAGYLALIMGGILYFFYMFICLNELYLFIMKKRSTN